MRDFMIRMMKSSWNGKRMVSDTGLKSINGYISMMGMIVFFVVLQTVSLMVVYSMSGSSLLKADKQSVFDLSVLSHVRHIIENNQYVERCHLPASNRIENEDIIVDNIEVELVDHQTYVSASYEREYPIEMRIYYDAHQIIGYEIESY